MIRLPNNISGKVKGNTIIEVLIALAIISFCSTLAVIIYLNIQKSSLPFFKIKAIEIAEKHLKETLEKKNFSEDNYKNEEFTVKKNIEQHSRYPDCLVIRIIIFDSNKKKLHELESVAYKGN